MWKIFHLVQTTGHRYPISPKIYTKIHTPAQVAALTLHPVKSLFLSLHISSQWHTSAHVMGLEVIAVLHVSSQWETCGHALELSYCSWRLCTFFCILRAIGFLWPAFWLIGQFVFYNNKKKFRFLNKKKSKCENVGILSQRRNTKFCSLTSDDTHRIFMGRKSLTEVMPAASTLVLKFLYDLISFDIWKV